MEQELELSAVIGFQGKLFNLERKVPDVVGCLSPIAKVLYQFELTKTFLIFRQGNGGPRTTP
jgi:hypothetical protein